MNTWIQRPAHTALADSDTTEYRGCLDALIATIEDMKFDIECIQSVKINFAADDSAVFCIKRTIEEAEQRAADLAHRLFERWIEVRGPCGVCPMDVAGRPCPLSGCCDEGLSPIERAARRYYGG